MAAQARPELAAPARRAFCPPPEFADPMERPVPLPLLLLSSFSLLAARGRGAPGPRPPPPDPHQGPALPGSLQLSVLRSACAAFRCTPAVIAWPPELRGIQTRNLLCPTTLPAWPQCSPLKQGRLVLNFFVFQTDPSAGSRSHILCWWRQLEDRPQGHGGGKHSALEAVFVRLFHRLQPLPSDGGCCTHPAPEQTDRKAGAVSSGMGAERKEKIEDRAEGFDHLLPAGPQECPPAVWWPRTTSPNPEP